jgi:hypothetical protein
MEVGPKPLLEDRYIVGALDEERHASQQQKFPSREAEFGSDLV